MRTVSLAAAALAALLGSLLAAGDARADGAALPGAAVSRPEGTGPAAPPAASESYAVQAPCAPPCRDDSCLWWESRRVHKAYVTVTGEHGFDADLQSDRGTLSLTRVGVGVDGTFPLGDRWSIAGAFHLERDWYDLSDPDAIVPGTGRLLEDAVFARLGLFATVRNCTGWGFGFGPIVQSAGATGADFAETLTYGAAVGVRIPLGGDTALILGTSVETSLEGSPAYFPLIDLEGSGTGKLHIDYLRSGISATGVRVAYDFSDTLTAGVAGRFDTRRWRLADDDRVPGGVFTQARIAPGVLVQWRPNDRVTVGLEGWLNVSDSIRIDDRDGDRITDFGAGTSWMVGLSVSIRF